MEKSKILLMGLGQCGCNLSDEMITKNKRYAGVFINSSLGDLANIKNANSNNTFTFNGTDGAGRNRKLAQSFIQDDIVRFSSFLTKFSQFKTIVIFTSLDGGTGSGSLPFTIKVLKKLFKDVVINVIGVLPRLDEDKLKLDNTLDCLAELEPLLKIINSIRFIDNNTRDTYEEINSEALEDFDLAYSIVGKHQQGNIDMQDSFNINTSQGYSVVLRLPDRCVNLDEVIQVARANSVYALPDQLTCTYAGINVKEGKYNVNELKRKFTATNTIYTTYNQDKFNVVVLSGCAMPKYAIGLIELEKENREDELRKLNNPTENLGFGLKDKSSNNLPSTLNIKENVIVSDDDISEDMFDADFFRI